MKTPTEIVGFMRDPDGISGGFAEATECYTTSWVPCINGSGPKAADVNSVQVLFKNAWVSFDGP
jgi:hypothetical protein